MSNERIDQENIFEGILEEIIGHIDMGEMTRIYGEEKATRLMGEVVKNNEIIMKTQKQLEELIIRMEKKKQEEREMERRREREQEKTDRWMEECRKKNEKEREEKETKEGKDSRNKKQR